MEAAKRTRTDKSEEGKGNDKSDVIPAIVRRGTNNGAWFHSRHLWVQNENTALLKDHVDRRSFNTLLEKYERREFGSSVSQTRRAGDEPPLRHARPSRRG